VSAPVFWAPLDGPVEVGGTLVVSGAEGRHAAVVRRLRAGEALVVTDGAGRAATCVVRSVAGDELTVAVESFEVAAAPTPRLALPKGERGETAVETMTEVGVDVIVPWAASRCVTRWQGERGARSLERWRGSARAAAKQSRRTWWPQIRPLATTADVERLLSAAALGVLLHEAATAPLAEASVPTSGDVVVVVGPEGGLDDAELDQLSAAGGAPLRLGPAVLRTSTAGTAAAAVLLARAGRWS
jgi:16S rRNA (uracil1498-N3)-methyltransferase